MGPEDMTVQFQQDRHKSLHSLLVTDHDGTEELAELI